ncbi:MAG: hypothetical protein H7Y61_10270 [Rhizobiales bacterium]|nr:hypothetical protein [Rhizobacter sp.]
MNRLASTRHRGRILLLAAALVCVQLLGLIHAVVHDHARAHLAQEPIHAAGESPAEHAGFASLFGGHDSQIDCDRFDHITHADLAGFDAPEFTSGHANGLAIVGHAGWHIAQQARGFLARGPPSQV